MSGYNQAMARSTRRSRGMPVLLILQKHALPGIVLNRSCAHYTRTFARHDSHKKKHMNLHNMTFSDITLKLNVVRQQQQQPFYSTTTILQSLYRPTC